MTRKQFEKIREEQSFDNAMEALYEENNFVTDYETLKQFMITALENENNGLALHILQAVYESEGDSDWYYYDYTAGTTCTPVCLNDIDDVESFIGFDDEED